MTISQFVLDHGCKNCGSKSLKTSVLYSCPLQVQYECSQCCHTGMVRQSNYRLPQINDISIEDYFKAKGLAEKDNRDLNEVLREFGATIDEPIPEYSIT